MGEAATLTVPEACEMLGISTWQAYQLIKRDEFPVPVLRLGRAIRIPRAPLRQYLGLPAIEVVLPPEPPALTPRAARALLQILEKAVERQGDGEETGD